MSKREERLFRSQTTRNANHIFSRDEAVQYTLEPDGELSDLEIEDEEDLDHEEDDNDPDWNPPVDPSLEYNVDEDDLPLSSLTHVHIVNRNGLQASLTKIPAEERQSIDEQMVPFKGKLRYKQYLKDKPHSWGIKIFSRAGASGIIYDFEVYTGKSSVSVTELGQEAEVVLRLAEEIPRNKNFKLFFDNYYTTEDLLKKKGRGSFDYRVETNSGIVVTKWFDNKSVCTASSFVGAEPSDNCKRWDRTSKKYVDVVRPLCIAEYNKFMGGVDLSDMLIELYRIDIRGKKWYMRLFYYFLDISVVNAWLLYRRHMGQQGRTHNKSFLDFKSEIANYLTSTNDGTPKPRGRPLRDQTVPLQKDQSLPNQSHTIVFAMMASSIGQRQWLIRSDAGSARLMLESSNRNCFKIFHTQ
ncbi:hypothetical protein QYM36_014414 [Artemia franciscana]|uniref:PiggyBac transposable element-derived protein domain-containing protein n=1 Tax=Artemia franciscana TaxID=6661 RepID=A0AA88HKL4_ARTSF|nr:hypothetical protein QYM36_014414 [Artemia franciscana]